MTRSFARLCLLSLLAAGLLLAHACGGESEPSTPTSGKLDLATDEPSFAIAYPPGDLQGGAPQAVASGDFNGDGKADLLLGAPYSDGPDRTRVDAGEAYVLLGPVDDDMDLADRQPDIRIFGALGGDMLGTGVAAGDLNGDGIDDIVVGAPGSNGLDNIRTDMGEAYVVFGNPSLPATIDTLSEEQDFLLQPAEGFSHLGVSFAIADVNGDSIADLIAGAPYAGRGEGTPPGSPRTTVGEVYIVFGAAELRGKATVAANDEDVRLSGAVSYDKFGQSVAAGDVNGDGLADVIVGASGYDAGGRNESGGVFVFNGGAGQPKHKTLAEADFTLGGADTDDSLGTVVAAADSDGDGRTEIMASAPSGAGPDNDRFASGEVAVFDPAKYAGPAIGEATADAVRRIFAPTNGELLTGGLTAGGGAEPKIAIGSTMRTTSDRPGAGWAYVVSPPADGDVDLSSGSSDGLTIEGAVAGDGFGAAIAFADLDDDGTQELIILAAGTQPADPNFRGRLYVFRFR